MVKEDIVEPEVEEQITQFDWNRDNHFVLLAQELINLDELSDEIEFNTSEGLQNEELVKIRRLFMLKAIREGSELNKLSQKLEDNSNRDQERIKKVEELERRLDELKGLIK